MVSRAELEKVIATYDVDGDRHLKSDERERYLRDFDETRIQNNTTHIGPRR